MTASIERLVPLEGCENFRDIGGYRTQNGSRVRRGVLFRSMTPEFMTERDVAYARDVLGIRFVADLRGTSDRDSGLLGQPPTQRSAIQYMSTSMREMPGLHDMPPEQALPLYLDHCGDGIAEAVSFLAGATPGAAVFHCLTGKDRTGSLAALLLGLFGVADEDIVEDYLLGAPLAEDVMALMAAAGKPLPEDASLHAKSPPAEPSIRAFLARLNQEYGGARAYLEGLGLSAELDRLVERMVEAPD